jgi:hypothetical protein
LAANKNAAAIAKGMKVLGFMDLRGSEQSMLQGYFLTTNGTEYSAVSHESLIRPPPAEFFAIFKWFYLVMGVWFLGSGILNVIAGCCLRARKHRTPG